MKKFDTFFDEISNLHNVLSQHEMYKHINTIEKLRIFMENHVFAVWDFMSLLKRLQIDITCTTLPWKPSNYPKDLVRFINEIVVGEESDFTVDKKNYSDHFTLYLESMKEINADTTKIELFLDDKLDINTLPTEVVEFINYNINLSLNGKTHEVAAAFFFGRENLIPDMFTSILNDFSKNFETSTDTLFPTLNYYLKRHIEIDGEEHSLLAKKCLDILCADHSQKWDEAKTAGIKSLELRDNLWRGVLRQLPN